MPFLVGLYALQRIRKSDDEGSDDQPPPPDPDPPLPTLPPTPRLKRIHHPIGRIDRGPAIRTGKRTPRWTPQRV